MPTDPDSPIALSASSAVVLGLLASGGPQTTYEMKSYIEVSIGFFWPFPSSQMYAETKRLEGAGLIEGEQEDFGRRRRVYRITDAGRDALEVWLGEPTDRPTEIRDIGLLKLFLSAGSDGADIGELAAEQASMHRDRLTTYLDIAAQIGENPTIAGRTIELGIAFEQVAVDFWERVAGGPDDRS